MNFELSAFASDRPLVEKNLIFIDSTVENYQGLTSANEDSELVILNPFRDGILQISEELANHDNVTSVHIVSHGKPGNIQLGNTVLNLDTFDNYADELQGWGKVLTEEADLLFYGCNIGADLDGETLINRIKDITDADIAASDDLTGNSALGGDWEWEINTGTIESGLAFSTEAIRAYNRVLASEANGMMMEHNDPISNLVPHSQTTHIPIKNGGWFNSSTWQNGQIPGDEANVLIPEGIKIWYGNQSDARLDTLRVDGTLTFRSETNSKMLVDTFVVSSDGKLNIGRENNPIQANKKAEIIFTSDTPIDTESDSQQLGRGLISHGKVEIYGTDKLDFVSLSQDVYAGENELTLDLPNDMTMPQGWQVGDQLVLGGTNYNNRGSDEDNSRFYDEVLTIAAINGNKISFTNNNITSGDNTVLRFDHERPDGYQDSLNLYVANTTRNVSFATENGDSVPTEHRGHVMFMHNPNVKVQNAGFYNLGRTDKNRLIDDPGQNVDGTSGSGTNPRGRYSLHFHRTGADDPNGTPAIANGNAVVGSPGWGIAHHDSHAVLENNVVFDVVGAGIAAEAGNEIGTWRNNITIKTTGDERRGKPDLQPSSDRVNRFDFGFNGEGYWVQGAGQIDIIDNIAISASEDGLTHYGGGDGGQNVRDAQTIAVANLLPEYQNIAKGTGDESVIDVSAVPLRKLSGFESYNTKRGISFWATLKNIDNQLEIEGAIADSKLPAHNFHSVADNFKVWNSRSAGVNFHYASQIDLQSGLIVGDKFNPQGAGIGGNSASYNNHFENIRIDGFEYGLTVPLDNNKKWNNSSLENVTFTNNAQNLGTRKSNNGSPTGYSNYLEIVNSTFDIPNNNQLPIAEFDYEVVGGLATKFDAAASIDLDSSEKNLNGNGIVSYGWDFDNDGNIDDFGRQVNHYFDSAGSRNVTLTVWDNQGATTTLTKTVNVIQESYDNLIIDGNFDSSVATRGFSSATADRGWNAANNWSKNSSIGNGGAAVISNYGAKGIGQSVLDDWTRRGNQTLSLDIKNTEGTKVPNQIKVSVWGINGEFNNTHWQASGPQQVGAIPMQRTNLLEETVGGSTFDWTNFSWNLNFGDGYQFIVFQVNPSGVEPAKGDYVAIDNIKIN